jgi:hypothetical protein
MKEAVGMEHFSLKRLYEEASGEGSLLETLEDMLRKALHMGISVHRGPFMCEVKLESRGGLVYREL